MEGEKEKSIFVCLFSNYLSYFFFDSATLDGTYCTTVTGSSGLGSRMMVMIKVNILHSQRD